VVAGSLDDGPDRAEVDVCGEIRLAGRVKRVDEAVVADACEGEGRGVEATYG
jgi:hypothetical protein